MTTVATVLHCDGVDCEAQTHVNDSEQWVQVTIAYRGYDLISSFCPRCWNEVLMRKAAVIHKDKLGEAQEKAASGGEETK